MTEPGTAVAEIGTMSGESQRLRDATKALTNTLAGRREQFEAALAGRIDAGTFLALVSNQFMSNPDLWKCSQMSIYVAAMEAATVGLKLDGEEACLVPWWNKHGGDDGQGEMEAQYQPMFQGFVRLMLRAGAKKVWAHVVRTGDHWKYKLGLYPDLEHEPVDSEDRGDVTHAYACVLLANGEFQFEVMDRAELDKVRKASKSKNSPAYRDWEDQMNRKAPLRRLRKFVELDATASAAFRLDIERDVGAPVSLTKFLPGQDHENPAERAEEAAQGAQQVLRQSIAAIKSSGDPLDRNIEFGEYQGQSWRHMLDTKTGYAYVKHFILEEADHPSLTDKLREALKVDVDRIGATRDEEHDKLVAEAYEKAMLKLSNLHGSSDLDMSDDDSDAYAKQLDGLRDEGNFDGILELDAIFAGLAE